MESVDPATNDTKSENDLGQGNDASHPFIKLSGVDQVYTVSQKRFILNKKTRDKILSDITLSVDCGKVVGLVGDSGAGKSVLARIVTLDEKPTKGTVEIEGEDVAQLSSRQLKEKKKSISHIVQDRHILLDLQLTAMDVIAGKRPQKKSDPEFISRTKDLMEKVGLNPDFTDRKAETFLGGQRQLLCILAGIIHKPKLVVADQSINALAPKTKIIVSELLRDLALSHKTAVLFIAHQLEFIQRFTDVTVVLNEGKIIEQGKTAEVFQNPQTDLVKNMTAVFNKTMRYSRMS